MRDRNRRRQRTQANNFKRQSQALTILTISTVLFGGTLFQIGFPSAIDFPSPLPPADGGGDVNGSSLPPADGGGDVNGFTLAVLLVAFAIFFTLMYLALAREISHIFRQENPVHGSQIAHSIQTLQYLAGMAFGIFVVSILLKLYS